MIKQIQLRGISRTPSDRLSEDGGLSESLNMYLDTAENAPAILPEDVTTKIGLPEGLLAERIFIHKTANYQNPIAVLRDRIVAFTPDITGDSESLTVMDLADGETVTDITSIGNTLVLSTTKNLYYILYKDREYSFLGNKVPFPHIHFFRKDEEYKYKQYRKDWTRSITGPVPFADRLANGEPKNPETPLDFGAAGVYNPEDVGAWTFYEINKDVWDKKDKEGNNENKTVEDLLKNRETLLEEITSENLGILPIFVRYSIVLYDGSELSSMPLLLFPSNSVETTVQTQAEMLYNTSGDLYMVNYNGFSLIHISGSSSNKIGFTIDNDILESSWSDVVEKIRFYVSYNTSLEESPLSSSIEATMDVYSYIEEGSFRDDNTNVYSRKKTLSQQGKVTFEESKDDYEMDLLATSSNVFLVKEVPIFDRKESATFSDEYTEFIKKEEIDLSQYVDTSREDYTPLATQKMLYSSDMKHYVQISSNLSTYNNQLVLAQPSEIIDYDYDSLNSLEIVPDAPGRVTFDVTYLIRAAKEDKVVKKTFTYNQEEEIYGFQIFPDSRAFKMIVVAHTSNGTKYGEFDMHPHPYLDCAYYYGGIQNRLADLCTADSVVSYEQNNVDMLDNKLIISEQDNPFYFPIEHRFTFQSKVVGVAVASTALSQGQFGQFPLYVFTEDGIWALETAADGSFLSQKPLSREVCVNPDSITSIDDAVVFVTSKGVMMISGSEVMNISPFMNGRHYVPNDSARNLIARQEGFEGFGAAISDETPFTGFMRDAKTAYDYTGQRLIFISPTNKDFQYVYKIDTQTWHKVAFDDLDLREPLNSFPECLIRGEKTEKHTVLVCLDNNAFMNTEELHSMVADFFPYDIAIDEFENFLLGNINLPLDEVEQNYIDEIVSLLEAESVNTSVDEITQDFSYIYNFSTNLDTATSQPTAKGILITRPFDLGMPDILKSITNVRIRGDFDKENVKYILQGSEDGRNFYTLNSLRGKSWTMFRIIIMADLDPTERISWIDIQFEPRFSNRLR